MAASSADLSRSTAIVLGLHRCIHGKVGKPGDENATSQNRPAIASKRLGQDVDCRVAPRLDWLEPEMPLDVGRQSRDRFIALCTVFVHRLCDNGLNIAPE